VSRSFPSTLSVITRLRAAERRRPRDEELTERGLAALAAARKGADLYVWKDGGWHLTGPYERAHAEELALRNPVSLVIYAAMPAKRRRRRR
jgi:hypothetical protein